MKAMIKTELERAFKSWGFWTALIIGAGISVSHFITVIIPDAVNPIRFFEVNNATVMPVSAFQAWIGNGVTFQYILYIRLVPVLAAIPYGVTYLSDIKSGIVKNYMTRTSKFNYLFAKYTAVFVTGGIAVILPLFINYLAAISVLPSYVWPIGVYAQGVSSMWSDVFFTNPHIYIMLYMILFFICGGFISTITLIVSNIVSNRFVAVIAPFIIAEFINAVFRMSDTKWVRAMAPDKLFSITQVNYEQSYIVVIAVLLVLGIVVYFIGGLKHETY